MLGQDIDHVRNRERHEEGSMVEQRGASDELILCLATCPSEEPDIGGAKSGIKKSMVIGLIRSLGCILMISMAF